MTINEAKNESLSFENRGECYIHCEKRANDEFAVIVTGQVKTIKEGLYSAIVELCSATGESFEDVLAELAEMSVNYEADSRALEDDEDVGN